MKLKPLGLSVLLAGLLCVGLASNLMAQSKKAGQAGQEKSCDGALDVVPAKALSFTRKRRPGKETNATPANHTPATTENSPKATRKKSR